MDEIGDAEILEALREWWHTSTRIDLKWVTEVRDDSLLIISGHDQWIVGPTTALAWAVCLEHELPKVARVVLNAAPPTESRTTERDVEQWIADRTERSATREQAREHLAVFADRVQEGLGDQLGDLLALYLHRWSSGDGREGTATWVTRLRSHARRR